MQLDTGSVQAALADAWDRWAQRCAVLTPAEWVTATRCAGWDVQALIAHVCPSEAMFDALATAATDGPAAVSGAAELLRRFNAAGGMAHTTADELARQAVSEAAVLTPAAAARRFGESAARLREHPLAGDVVIAYPAVGSTDLAVITQVALMEATVHLLDLAEAITGIEPSPPRWRPPGTC